MTTTPIDRLPPHSIEAEEAVLGSILIDPEAVSRVSEFLKVDDFYIVKHQWVWDACLALRERREPTDFITVTHELEARGQLAEIGGAAFVSHLINGVPTAIHAEGYGHVVERTANRRRLLRAASDQVPRWLERVYHRPPKVLAEAVFRRVVSTWCLTSPGAAGPALMVLIDRERMAETRGRVLALRPDAQIEII